MLLPVQYQPSTTNSIMVQSLANRLIFINYE